MSKVYVGQEIAILRIIFERFLMDLFTFPHPPHHSRSSRGPKVERAYSKDQRITRILASLHSISDITETTRQIAKIERSRARDRHSIRSDRSSLTFPRTGRQGGARSVVAGSSVKDGLRSQSPSCGRHPTFRETCGVPRQDIKREFESIRKIRRD
jgi:hypothetical protein